MKKGTATRLLKLGSARRMTRAGGPGPYHELQPIYMYDLPAE